MMFEIFQHYYGNKFTMISLKCLQLFKSVDKSTELFDRRKYKKKRKIEQKGYIYGKINCDRKDNSD